MKAAVVVGYNDIQVQDIQEPEVFAGQVKVAVRYCGICGSDIPRVLKGACHTFPQVLGHEFSGIITEVADDVTSVKVGDHVVGVPLVPCMECDDCRKGNYSLCKHYSFIGSRQQGAMAEYIVVPESNVYLIKKTVPLHLAALFEPSTVALHGIYVNSFQPKSSDNILVVGAGVIALFTIQWCRILGGENITTLIRNKSRRDIAIKYGSNNVVSSLDEDYETALMKLSSGKGYDYIFDAAGTSKTIKDCFRFAANKSRICLIGTPTSSIEFSMKEWELMNRKEFNLTGSWMSYSANFPGKEWEMTAKHMADGTLFLGEDMLYTFYPLDEIRKAFDEFVNNASNVKGRIMVSIN